MKVRQILATKPPGVVTITPEALIREAIALLVEHGIGALVVVGQTRRPVGILSERDVVWRAVQDQDVLLRTVAEVMTRDLVLGTPQDDLMAVAHLMTERRFRHLPIVEGDELIGMVSIGDVLKAQRDSYRGEIDTLETRLMAKEE